MIILGLDLSLTSTGCVVVFCSKNTNRYEVLHAEQITTAPDPDAEHIFDVIRRSIAIRNRILEIIQENSVTDVAVEAPSYGSIGSATRDLAILWGIIMAAIENTNMVAIPPTSLKKVSTGNGRATKKDMVECISTKDPSFYAHLQNTTIKAGKYDLADAYLLTRYHGELT